MCVCVCVCACVRACVRACVCVCVRAHGICYFVTVTAVVSSVEVSFSNEITDNVSLDLHMA